MSEDIVMKMYIITHLLPEQLPNWGGEALAYYFIRNRQSHIFT